MRIEFITKNYNASDKLKDIMDRKLSRLDKFFDDDITVKALLKEIGDTHILELTIMLDGSVLRSEVSGDNMYDNIDYALPKLEKQVIKHRKKLSTKSKKVRIKELDQSFIQEAHEEKKRSLVRTKSFALTPMTIEDAVDEIELVGHSFYVFANKSTGKVNILYSRKDGDYGVIEALM